jgi:superfamily I DNA/RNA helicase
MQPLIGISTDFFECLASIPKQEQKRVRAFITKFRNEPTGSGINYERINDAADSNYRSVRIGDNYRGIVLAPESGNVYLLLWVAKHDDAYDWARRNRCNIHPATGSLQVFDATHIEPEPVSAPPPEQRQNTPIFHDRRDRELLRLGVPEERLDLVRAVQTDDQLEELETRLPRDAFEALYMLAAGTDLDEVMRVYALPAGPVDTTDYAAALERDTSRRRFMVVDDDIELQKILEAPLEKWRVFLHPSQRRLVEWECNGPIRVLGGAGTGKTVVAMHRARWLVRKVFQRPEERVLLTTFTANLATDIRENLKKICEPEELDRIEVIHIDAWVGRFLQANKYPHRVVYSGQPAYRKLWKLALDNAPTDLGLADSFYHEEWDRVILPQRVMSRTDYFRARRIGRGVALNRRQRAEIWPVFEEMHIQLQQQGLRPAEMALQDARELIEEGRSFRPYASVIVDEAQDMGPDAMKLIRALIPTERANDLFIVGDGHQRIYRNRFALSDCGINIRGRSRKLRINYRTTEETRRFAVAVLEGQQIDDLDHGEDSSLGYRSLMHGEPPEVKLLDNESQELDWIAEQIKALQQQGFRDSDTCIVARTNRLVSGLEEGLKSRGLSTRRLSRDAGDDRKHDGVRLATMHRVKGLEFQHVFLAAINQGVCPLDVAVESTDDPTERRSSELNERALFHVAASRAIHRLWVSASAKPSPFLSGSSGE